METKYNFSEIDKLLIIECNDYVAYHCYEHGTYLKYKNASSTTCPWCNKSNDPIQGVRELRKKFKQELNIN